MPEETGTIMAEIKESIKGFKEAVKEIEDVNVIGNKIWALSTWAAAWAAAKSKSINVNQNGTANNSNV